MTSEKQTRLAPWLFVAPAAIAVVTYAVFVVRNAVNVVYWDYWASVPMLHALDDGHLRWSQIWEQAANNRIVVPHLITLAVGSWFRLDVRIELIGAVVLLGVAAVLLMLTQRRNDGAPLYVYAPIAFFMFSIVQWQTALWNVQMPRFLILALFALAMYAVCRSAGWGWFAVAAVAAVAAALSLLDGFLVWPAIALLIWCDGRPQRSRRVLVWAGIGAVTAVVYFIGYDFSTGYSGGAGYTARHPFAAVKYFLVLLGGFTRSSSGDLWVAAGCGVLMLGLSAWIVVRFWRSERTLADALPVALVIYVLLFDLSTLLGRGSAGPGQALASRYTTYNLLVFVAVYFAVVRAWRLAEDRERSALLAVGAVGGALAIVLATVSVTTGRHEGDRFAAELRTSVQVLRHYRTESPPRIERYVCPALCGDLVPQEAPFLEQQGYSVFADRP